MNEKENEELKDIIAVVSTSINMIALFWIVVFIIEEITINWVWNVFQKLFIVILTWTLIYTFGCIVYVHHIVFVHVSRT